MKTTVTKALALSSIASVGLFSAVSADASAFQPAQEFFNPNPVSSTIADGTWSATGISSNPSPLTGPVADWTVALNAYNNNLSAIFTVSRGSDPFSPSPNSFTTSYSLTNLTAPIRAASVALDLVGLNGSKSGTIAKEIYADANFTNLLGIASVTVTGGNATFVDAFFDARNTIYVKDIVQTEGGNLSSYTNSYTVPEPLTLFGAATAVSLGGAFKRRLKNKNRQG